MEHSVRIGIVEDEVIIADSLQLALESLGYDVPGPAANYDQAIRMLDAEQPDLALLDINLKRGKDGIEVARYIREHMNIPVIFLTANSDPATVERAKAVKPNAYLVKPFQKPDLYAAIEIAINSFTGSKNNAIKKEKNTLASDVLFIKDGYYFHKVKFDDITHLSSEHVYITVHTRDKNFLVRASLQDYLEKFDPSKFIRVHQRFAVNINAVDKINSACLCINNEEIPVSKSYRDILLSRLNIG